jgi:hypothetical protein
MQKEGRAQQKAKGKIENTRPTGGFLTGTTENRESDATWPEHPVALHLPSVPPSRTYHRQRAGTVGKKQRN